MFCIIRTISYRFDKKFRLRSSCFGEKKPSINCFGDKTVKIFRMHKIWKLHFHYCYGKRLKI